MSTAQVVSESPVFGLGYHENLTMDPTGRLRVNTGGTGGSSASNPSFVSLSSAQQVKSGNTVVAIPANTSTLVWTSDPAARVLRLVPLAGNANFLMQDDGQPATANSTPIPAGYVFNLIEPPPSANIYVYSTIAGSISVSEGT